MDNAGATLIFYNRKHGNRVFRISKKKSPCRAKSVYKLLIVLFECREWRLDRDRSIFSTRQRTSVDWHWHTVVFFHLLWDTPARARFFYANCSPSLYLMKIDRSSRVIWSRLWQELPREEAVLVSDHSFHPSSILPFRSVCQLWRDTGQKFVENISWYIYLQIEVNIL